VAPDFPQTPAILAVTSDGLAFSEDGGSTWFESATDVPPEQALVAVSAPQGLRPGAPLLLGLSSGEVVQTSIARPFDAL